jgi:FtsX-like permease family
VGTVAFYDDLAQDEVDRLPTWLLFTPPITAPLDKGPQYIDYALQLRPGVSVGDVERELVKSVPAKVTYTVHTSASEESQINLSVRPEALALGIFGLLVVLSALFIALQLIARELRANRDDQEVMRALGALGVAMVLDAMAPFALACLLGTALALVVALALSPLSPLGPVHPVLAGSFHLNASVVLPGCAVLLVGAVVGGVLLARRSAPGRRVSTISIPGGSRVARFGAGAGLGAAAVAGLHFAFESGRGRRGAPVRSVLVGVALSVALLTTTLTFGAGLSTLVAHPRLYGWNWDYALSNTGGGVPPASMKVLTNSPHVAGWSSVTFGDVQIDGQTIPAMLEPSRAAVAPPLLSGHEVDAKDQIVLGQSTLAALHKEVGDHVILSYGTKADAPAYVAPMRLTIVGSATLPAIGRSQELHPSMGTGAVLDSAVINKGLYDTLLENLVVSDVDMVLVRLRPGTTPGEGLAVMNKAAVMGDKVYQALPNGEGEGISMTVLPVQYPAEIINYRSIGDIPLYLSLGFALGVVIAFAFTVVSLVRRRRRDLALLKTLGFTRRQLSECIAWQASATVLTGLLVGIPLGILAGHWLWDEFARQIFAVPFATIPTESLMVLAASALVVANVIAYVPGRNAARVAAAALRGD